MENTNKLASGKLMGIRLPYALSESQVYKLVKKLGIDSRTDTQYTHDGTTARTYYLSDIFAFAVQANANSAGVVAKETQKTDLVETKDLRKDLPLTPAQHTQVLVL